MIEKPTIEQVAWVFDCLAKNAQEQGTYRHLIYNIMGYGLEAYYPLIQGLYINNDLSDMINKEDE
jgi:hypothetical protein